MPNSLPEPGAHFDPTPTRYDATPILVVKDGGAVVPVPTPAPTPAAGWWSRQSPLVRHLLSSAVVVLISVAVTFLRGQGVEVPPLPVVVEQVAPIVAVPHPTGWVSRPEEVDKVRNALPEGARYFSQTPAGRAAQGATGTVLLSDAAKIVLGGHLPARDQRQVGSCVSFGTATAVEYLQIQQIASGNPQEFKVVCNEAIYGGSRIQIGKGQVGQGDGSITAWAGQWVKEYGVIPRERVGQYDLNSYSETRCRQWGQSGCPKDLEGVAKLSPVKGIAFARTADEAAKAIRQGYTIAIGSQVGFGSSNWTRDRDGFLNKSGQWGHCQAVIGVRDDSRRGFLIVNSWGPDWVKGPTGPHDIPPGSYWVDWSTFDAMAAEGDCIVFSDAVGFPARNLDWFFGARPAGGNPARAGDVSDCCCGPLCPCSPCRCALPALTAGR